MPTYFCKNYKVANRAEFLDLMTECRRESLLEVAHQTLSVKGLERQGHRVAQVT